MVDREGKPGNAVRPRMGPHEEFLELCALSTTGCLTAEERNRLRQHLAVCADCRKAMEQFEAVIDKAIPALAPGLSGDIPEESSSFSVEKAEASFFKRLSEESTEGAKRPGEAETLPRAAPFPTRTSFPGRLDRFHFWLPLAAVFLLCVTLGILTYRMGIHRGADVAREELGTGGVAPAPVFETAEAVSRDRDTANAQLAERSKTITELRTEMAVQSGEIAKLKALESGQERTAQTGEEEKKQLAEERDHLAQELEMKQEALQASEKKLDALEQQRSDDLAHAAGLEAKLEDLSRAVRDQEHTTDQQRELLSHDRDIRELMGARDCTMEPLIPPGSFVQIDAKQTRVRKSAVKKNPDQSQFRRPIYFVDIRDGYACGWCEIEGGLLTLIPHPDSPEKIRTFRYPDEAEIVGRVTGIAMRITGEDLVTLEESFERRNPPKK